MIENDDSRIPSILNIKGSLNEPSGILFPYESAKRIPQNAVEEPDSRRQLLHDNSDQKLDDDTMQELFGSLTRFKRASGGTFEHGSYAIEEIGDKHLEENPFGEVAIFLEKEVVAKGITL